MCGVGDFTLTDEVYGDLALEPDVVPLMQAKAINGSRGTHPMLWERGGWTEAAWNTTPSDTTLRSIEHPVHARILARCALWALGRPEADVLGRLTAST